MTWKQLLLGDGRLCPVWLLLRPSGCSVCQLSALCRLRELMTSISSSSISGSKQQQQTVVSSRASVAEQQQEGQQGLVILIPLTLGVGKVRTTKPSHLTIHYGTPGQHLIQQKSQQQLSRCCGIQAVLLLFLKLHQPESKIPVQKLFLHSVCLPIFWHLLDSSVHPPAPTTASSVAGVPLPTR